MTDEELEKKAIFYAGEHCDEKDDDGFWLSDEEMLRRAFIAGAKENGIIWHDLRKDPDDLPKVNRLVRVRLMSGMEHICETCYYEPSEDEIGYGKLIISFYELNGEWIDDTEIIAWCEVPKFEVEE